MSTVHEVITARHSGLKCLAISLITNACMTNLKALVDHPVSSGVEEEVFNVAKKTEPLLKDFVGRLVQRLVSSEES